MLTWSELAYVYLYLAQDYDVLTYPEKWSLFIHDHALSWPQTQVLYSLDKSVKLANQIQTHLWKQS